MIGRVSGHQQARRTAETASARQGLSTRTRMMMTVMMMMGNWEWVNYLRLLRDAWNRRVCSINSRLKALFPPELARDRMVWQGCGR